MDNQDPMYIPLDARDRFFIFITLAACTIAFGVLMIIGVHSLLEFLT